MRYNLIIRVYISAISDSDFYETKSSTRYHQVSFKGYIYLLQNLSVKNNALCRISNIKHSFYNLFRKL